MAIELHSSQPSPETIQRVTRMMSDVNALIELTGPQARAIYQELESMRDVLSLILDRADGKSN